MPTDVASLDPGPDRMPARSYALIALLDAELTRPPPPTTATDAAAFRGNLDRYLYQCGARALVDELVAQVADEIGEAEDADQADEAGDEYPRVLTPDGDVRALLSSIRMAAERFGQRLRLRSND